MMMDAQVELIAKLTYLIDVAFWSESTSSDCCWSSRSNSMESSGCCWATSWFDGRLASSSSPIVARWLFTCWAPCSTDPLVCSLISSNSTGCSFSLIGAHWPVRLELKVRMRMTIADWLRVVAALNMSFMLSLIRNCLFAADIVCNCCQWKGFDNLLIKLLLDPSNRSPLSLSTASFSGQMELFVEVDLVCRVVVVVVVVCVVSVAWLSRVLLDVFMIKW